MADGAVTEASEEAALSIAVELIAVLVAVADGSPLTMTIDDGRALPSGPFVVGHRSLQSGLRAWVERQTRHPLGYVEQLYTFADSDRRPGAGGARAISISYLGLTREEPAATPQAAWRPWYDYFPWEDHRRGRPPLIEGTIAPALERWARAAPIGPRAGRAPRSPSGSTGDAGTRSSFCSAMSFFTRRGSFPRRAARGRIAKTRRSAGR